MGQGDIAKDYSLALFTVKTLFRKSSGLLFCINTEHREDKICFIEKLSSSTSFGQAHPCQGQMYVLASTV